MMTSRLNSQGSLLFSNTARRMLALFVASTFVCAGVLTAFASSQRPELEDVRTLVGRVQEDLRHSAKIGNHDEKDRERYENAQKHLSEFDRELSRRKFDKDKLDAAIDDVKNVVDHNTLATEARDALNVDLRDLRVVRESR